MLSSIWDLKNAGIVCDTSTDQYEWHEVREARDNVSGTSNYRLYTNDRDQFFLPSNAYLSVDVQVKAGGSAVATSDRLGLVADPWSIFEHARLKFNNSEIANLPQPGKACHMRKLVEMSPDYMQSVATISGYHPDEVSDGYVGTALGSTGSAPNVTEKAAPAVGAAGTDVPGGMYESINYDVLATTTAGAYVTRNIKKNTTYNDAFRSRVDRSPNVQTLFIPLAEAFPILDDMGTVSKGLRIELELTKQSNVNRCVFGKFNASAISIDISRISMWIPRLRPSTSMRQQVTATLKEEQKLMVPYHHLDFFQSNLYSSSTQNGSFKVTSDTNRPSLVLVGFQHASRDSDYRLNSLEFDRGTLQSIHVRLNGQQHPQEEFELSEQKYVRIVQGLHEIGAKSFQNYDGSLVDFKKFADGPHSLIAFNLAHHDRALFDKSSIADLEIRWALSAAWPNSSDYQVCCAVVSERQLEASLGKGDVALRKV